METAPESNESAVKDHQRPIWIIVFAILLASIAMKVKAEETLRVETSVSETLTVEHPLTEVEFNGQRFLLPKSISEGDSPTDRFTERRPAGSRSGRVHSVCVESSLANFDSDADPDGWIAQVVLYDRDDHVAAWRYRGHRVTASFELQARTPTAGFAGYANAETAPLKWAVPLIFDRHGVASVRLPLRGRLRSGGDAPAIGEPLAGPFADGLSEWGVLKVRVSIPSEGVFDAVTPIRLRPSVLVDTRWPYH